MCSAARWRKPRIEGDQHRHAGCRRDEVLHGQPEHLRQVAHRRLAAVALPVGVGGEADGRVERRVGRDGAEPLRVERQHALEALQEVDHEQAGEIEQQHRDGVGLPGHPLLGIDAGQPIEQPLERAEQPIEQQRRAIVDAGHVRAQRLGQRNQDDEVEEDLEESVGRHQKRSGASRATRR